MPSVELSVVIANYNGEPWLEPCLSSLISQADGLAWEAIVVDNHSQDGSVGLLRREFPWVRVIPRTKNVGFAQASNEGVALSQGRYILLLNNDTVFVSGLKAMMAFLDEHPQCAGVGPQMLNSQGDRRASWGYFPVLSRLTATMLFLDRLPVVGSRFRPLLVRPGCSQFSDVARAVDWASGACLLMRREALDEIGLLDATYFMYGEDVEWCYRAWQGGFEIWVLPEAQLIHHGAGGSGGSGKGLSLLSTPTGTSSTSRISICRAGKCLRYASSWLWGRASVCWVPSRCLCIRVQRTALKRAV